MLIFMYVAKEITCNCCLFVGFHSCLNESRFVFTYMYYVLYSSVFSHRFRQFQLYFSQSLSESMRLCKCSFFYISNCMTVIIASVKNPLHIDGSLAI